MRFKSLIAAIIISLVAFTLYSPLSAQAYAGANSDYLDGIMNLIESKYNYDVDETELLEGAVKGMFYSLDDYTEFYTKEEAEKFLQSVDGNYEGIGVVLSRMGNFVIISRVFQNSPAETAGLCAGDKIAIVDDKEVIGTSIDTVSSLIKGEKGSTVSLGIIRNGSKDIIKINVARDRIKVNPVGYEIRDNIAYLSIQTFNSNTYKYLHKALMEIDKEQVNKIILDLRNNTGGEVKQAVAVAREFVPAGIITTLTFGAGKQEDIVFKSSLKECKYELVVLVNSMTASSSEILAGAIQDSKAGILVGTKTYGKARVQSVTPILTSAASAKYAKQNGINTVNANYLINKGVRPVNDDILGWAKITTGIYLTPANRNIDEQGLSPDLTVEDHKLVNGVYVNNIIKLGKTMKPGLNSESMDVYNAEKILLISGYDIDKPDMILDGKTFKAIKQFQKDEGLYPYGVLDYNTQEAFNHQRERLLLEIDKQYAEAVKILNK